MSVQLFLKRVILLGIVIVIRSQRSSIRADGLDDDDLVAVGRVVVPIVPIFPLVPVVDTDSDEVLIGIGDSSEEVVGLPMSSTASLFSSLGRPPRDTNRNREGCFSYDDSSQLCASDGNFYNDMCTIIENGLHLAETTDLCEVCKPRMEPCDKKTPLCVGTEVTGFWIYEDECLLNRTRCARAKAQPGLSVRQVIDQLSVQSIGNCQEEVDSSRLTCFEILRGKCPRDTTAHRVCNTTEPYMESKTKKMRVGKSYKNICRVLHKRCKKDDDTCFDFMNRCDRLQVTSVVEEQNCSKYILNFDVGSSQRTCFTFRTDSTRICECVSKPPVMPQFPPEIKRQYSLTKL